MSIISASLFFHIPSESVLQVEYVDQHIIDDGSMSRMGRLSSFGFSGTIAHGAFKIFPTCSTKGTPRIGDCLASHCRFVRDVKK